MGMFDSFLDANDNEWQTKAYDLRLATYRLGDRLPIPSGGDGGTYQVKILGVCGGDFRSSYALVQDDILTGIDVARDRALPLVD